MKVLFVNATHYYEIYSDMERGIELCSTLLNPLMSERDANRKIVALEKESSPRFFINDFNLDKSFTVEQASLILKSFIEDIVFIDGDLDMDTLSGIFSKE